MTRSGKLLICFKFYHQDPGDYDDPGKRRRVIHAASLKIFAAEHFLQLKKLKRMYDREEKTQFGTKRRNFLVVDLANTRRRAVCHGQIFFER